MRRKLYFVDFQESRFGNVVTCVEKVVPCRPLLWLGFKTSKRRIKFIRSQTGWSRVEDGSYVSPHCAMFLDEVMAKEKSRG